MELMVCQNKIVTQPGSVRFFIIGAKYRARYGTLAEGDEKNIYVDFDAAPVFTMSQEIFETLFGRNLTAGKIYLADIAINPVSDFEKLDGHNVWLTRCRGFTRSKSEVDIFVGNVTRIKNKRSVYFQNDNGAVAVLPLKYAERLMEEEIEAGMAVPISFNLQIIQSIR